MSAHASGGSPAAKPQRYHTLPTAIVSQAAQQDRTLKQSELKTLANFFSSGEKRLQIAAILSQNANEIVAAAADRIFFNGSPMAYMDLAKPLYREQMPGSNVPLRFVSAPPKEVLKLEVPRGYGNPLRGVFQYLQTQFGDDRDPLPSGFRTINVARYGPRRMKNSMRDLAWFLRYVTYAIVAGDSSILAVNVRGLRGVIPEDVTEATVVAIREMRWRSLRFFKQDPEASEIIREPFDVLVAEYLAEKPSVQLRQGFSADQQGLVLPAQYTLAETPRSKYVIKPGQSATQQEEAIRAAYRQVFERDITREYGVNLADLESKLKSGEFSTKEFIRQLGRSRLYRKYFYEPFVVSRAIELAVRHFLGRGVSSIEEFQEYFDVISKNGLHALIDALVDSEEYSDYFGEETVPYLRGYGYEAQECRNWGPQFSLFKYSAPVHKVPQFITLFGEYRKPLPNQHPYGAGNDPLEIQFGAVFPQTSWNAERPALVGKDHRRILIRSEAGNGNGNGNHAAPLGKVPGSSNHRILKLDQRVHTNGNGAGSKQGPSVSLSKNSPEAVILGAYRQLFGRDVYAEQRLVPAELKLSSGEITVREFVRRLAKSRLFRKLYWDSLYVTKAIEYIHRRLLGRPTYGREEIGRYYDICARQGFNALIDALVDSADYLETFGEDTVPYERFVTPRGYEMRSRGNSEVATYTIGLGNPIATETRVADLSNWVKASLKGANFSRYGIRQPELQMAGKPAHHGEAQHGEKPPQVETDSPSTEVASATTEAAHANETQTPPVEPIAIE
ncbi:phycobilisome rod-core linker polypeptide [Kovacikia minuta CCNUW1]|uniref:phycobilisome rod-core linker polypeptide n=1 Tax=Kovacikia minuta TaxID=2931930 RepID=UPI001CCAD2A4|nr:phycobilisome rod-core linker polypeptide [Kovacikia minuta]UBF24296.1 phycobilisome rod-core linker polypeptide [Kovacikia minuta CCNUW1]